MASEDKRTGLDDGPPLPQGEQANLVHPDPPNPPFQDELTIIWRREKAELHGRLDRQEQVIEALAQRVKTLENHLLSAKTDRTAWDASKPRPTPGAGIGQAIPRSRAVRLPQEATEYIPSPETLEAHKRQAFEADYEGPREGTHGNVGPS